VILRTCYRIALAVGIALCVACSSQHTPEPQPEQSEHPEWSYTASIYEVNVRQYSPGGTFKEFEQHLLRLKDLGVGILWFMPIHPIGEVNRKGPLGSYYSVKDYLAINPEFGTLDDFKALVDHTHDLGMYVMIDWVANHTAWDNSLTVYHPEWYVRDEYGNFVPPVPAWDDVIQLDYESSELRRYMIDAMRFWIEEVDVDGFRCDAAGMVPLDFWEAASAELKEIKPLLMLAEWESIVAHDVGFDMTYGSSLYYTLNSVARGWRPASDIATYVTWTSQIYPEDAYRMYFTSNHDENSWNGTVFERLGEGAAAFAVLVTTLEGMPLVYSGQEVGLDKRLAFFDKDEIEWRASEFEDLYTRLLNLKQRNKALRNGERGGVVSWLGPLDDPSVLAFIRIEVGHRVLVILNLSGATQQVELAGDAYPGEYTDVFTGEAITFYEGTTVDLDPWEYRVYAFP
jgi:cyclomaltodextrinase